MPDRRRVPDRGEVLLDGEPVHFKRPQDARSAGIETVYQTLAVAPSLDVAANLFLGREVRRKGPLGSVLRITDRAGMRERARARAARARHLDAAGRDRSGREPVRRPAPGGRRRAGRGFGSKVVVLDEPTAALGVRESGQVLELVRTLRDKGVPVIIISHNMPQVFEVADRIHIQRLGRRAATITPQSHTMTEAVAIMTGAAEA